jgi:hypothetical protein
MLQTYSSRIGNMLKDRSLRQPCAAVIQEELSSGDSVGALHTPALSRY